MRLAGIDYGGRRVGIASTDETGQFALPRAVWLNDKELVPKILTMVKEEGIEWVVIGESKNLDRTKNPIFIGIENLKSKLEEVGVKVTLHPEVYTTLEAERLQGRHELIDASAAALILKSYIDSHK